MTKEEVNKLIMQACERTWNEKTCKEIFKALSQEPTEKPMTVDEMEREYEKSKALFHKIVECDDAISRKSIKQKLQEHHDFFVNAYGGFSNLPRNDKSRVDEITNCIAMVVNEPPVTPKSESVTEFADRCRECGKMRKGHWIYDETIENWRCSKCNETPKTMGYVGTTDFMAEHFKFCNHCGAKMIEPQESERK